jgi:hypothetical protein
MMWPRDDGIFQLPADWTPEQALVVYDWLTELSAVVWHRYEMPIRELLEAEPEYRDPAQQDMFGFDDPIPF